MLSAQTRLRDFKPSLPGQTPLHADGKLSIHAAVSPEWLKYFCERCQIYAVLCILELSVHAMATSCNITYIGDPLSPPMMHNFTTLLDVRCRMVICTVLMSLKDVRDARVCINVLCETATWTKSVIQAPRSCYMNEHNIDSTIHLCSGTSDTGLENCRIEHLPSSTLLASFRHTLRAFMRRVYVSVQLVAWGGRKSNGQ